MNTENDAPKTPTDSHIRLDDLTMQRQVAHYPEELRQPVMWLAWYIREKCNGDVGNLWHLATETLDIPTDKTNWNRILRGQWNRDNRGEPLNTPIISLAKLIKHIELIRDYERRTEQQGVIPFVMTPTAQSIFNYIDSRRVPGRVNKFGLIYGYTGTQKTATFREYARRNNHGACVWLECSSNGSMADFKIRLATRYGGSVHDSASRAHRRIIETVRSSERTIIVDNAQSAYRDRREAQQPIFNWLREIQEETNCTVILSVTAEFHQKLSDRLLSGYFEQFEGRCGGKKGFLRLPDYPTEEDVEAFAQAFAIEDYREDLDLLVAIAQQPGRVRYLFEVFQQAKRKAEHRKRKLTMDLIRDILADDLPKRRKE